LGVIPTPRLAARELAEARDEPGEGRIVMSISKRF